MKFYLKLSITNLGIIARGRLGFTGLVLEFRGHGIAIGVITKIEPQTREATE